MALVQVRGMNSAGQILGYYQDLSSSSVRSLLRSADGTYTSIAVPQALQTNGAALNNLGQITGSYIDETGTHSFIRAPDGTYTTFDIPPRGTPVNRPPVPVAINDRGELAGGAYAEGSITWGFLLSADRTTYTTVAVPDANSTQVVAINNNGEIFGYCQFGGSCGLTHGFVRRADGRYLLIDAPGSVQETSLSGANNRGQVVVNGMVNGMVLNADGSSATLDAGLTVTGAVIDDTGRMAGCAAAGAGCRGFIAVPSAGTQPVIRAQRGVISPLRSVAAPPSTRVVGWRSMDPAFPPQPARGHFHGHTRL
jgi:hypothetical protein